MTLRVGLEFKEQLKALLLEKLESDLRLVTSSAIEAREAATHPESKADNKYDTRGLEASYLAGAQAKRASELADQMEFLRHWPLRSFKAEELVALSALVLVESEGKESWYLIVPKGGGGVLELHGHRVQLMTPVSPLGSELVGRRQGDTFEILFGAKQRSYEILEIV